MSYNVINPYQIFYDSTGQPRANGTVTFYVNTTTTLGSIYSDEALTVSQSNPYTLDAYGRILGDVKYSGLMTIAVANADGSDVITTDNVATTNSGVLSEWGGGIKATRASTTTFTITGDYTATFIGGQLCKATGGADRIFTVDSSSYSSPNTTVTVRNIYTNTSPPVASTLHANMDYVYVHVISESQKAGTGAKGYSQDEYTKYDVIKTITHFRCTVDGTTNTQTELQAAATAAAGKTLFIENGSYNLTSAVTIPSNTTVIFESHSAKIIQGVTDISLFDLSDSVNVTIDGGYFDGNALGTTLSSIVNNAIVSVDTSELTKNVTVKNCIFDDFYSWSVYFAGLASGTYSYNVWVKDNHILNAFDEGINLYYIKKGIVKGNLITNHAKEAIKATTSNEILIEGNKIYNAATGATDGPLINVGTDCSKIQIIGNYCYQGNKGVGIEKRVTDLVISGNIIEGCIEEGIGVASTAGDASPMKRVSITGNVTRDTGQHGIKVAGISGQIAEAVTITGNSVFNCGTNTAAPGILAYYCEDATITGNAIDTSAKDGIQASQVTSISIIGNTTRDTQQNGIDAQNVTSVVINGNHCSAANLSAGSYNGIHIESTVTNGTTASNICIGDGVTNQYIGVYNQATNPMVGQNVCTNFSNAAVRTTSAITDGAVYCDLLAVGNTAVNTNTPSGATARHMQVYAQDGSLLGYIPVYAAAW